MVLWLGHEFFFLCTCWQITLSLHFRAFFISQVFYPLQHPGWDLASCLKQVDTHSPLETNRNQVSRTCRQLWNETLSSHRVGCLNAYPPLSLLSLAGKWPQPKQKYCCVSAAGFWGYQVSFGWSQRERVTFVAASPLTAFHKAPIPVPESENNISRALFSE